MADLSGHHDLPGAGLPCTWSLEPAKAIGAFFHGVVLWLVPALAGVGAMAVGFHAAWMTGTQLLEPHQGQFAVAGMGTLQFVAFLLLPAAATGVWLDRLRPGIDWAGREPPKTVAVEWNPESA